MLYQLPKSEPQELPLLLPTSLRLESHPQPFLLLSGASPYVGGSARTAVCGGDAHMPELSCYREPCWGLWEGTSCQLFLPWRLASGQTLAWGVTRATPVADTRG